MPNRDRTGPTGLGPMTGGRRGSCRHPGNGGIGTGDGRRGDGARCQERAGGVQGQGFDDGQGRRLRNRHRGGGLGQDKTSTRG